MRLAGGMNSSEVTVMNMSKSGPIDAIGVGQCLTLTLEKSAGKIRDPHMIRLQLCITRQMHVRLMPLSIPSQNQTGLH